MNNDQAQAIISAIADYSKNNTYDSLIGWPNISIPVIENSSDVNDTPDEYVTRMVNLVGPNNRMLKLETSLSEDFTEDNDPKLITNIYII